MRCANFDMKPYVPEHPMINFLEETEKALANHGLTFKNVKYIMNAEGCIPIADFITQAGLINYDNDFGIVVIDPSLKIVGVSWWMQRFNYDGKEGWIFLKKTQPSTVTLKQFNLLEDRPSKDYDYVERIEK